MSSPSSLLSNEMTLQTTHDSGKGSSIFLPRDERPTNKIPPNRPLPPAAQRWGETQICDAISCTRVSQPLPPHLGAPAEPMHVAENQRRSSEHQWKRWMTSTAKNHFVASVGEFVGTTMFLFLAFGATTVVIANTEPPANAINKLLYISLAFGFSLMVNAWIFFRISGALFNPAVTLAMVLVGAINPVRAVCLFLSQLLGSIAASALVLGIFPPPLDVNTTLSNGTTVAQGVWIEALLTAELVFTILMLAKEKHRSTFMAPVGIGLALFIAQMVGVLYTGGSLNPARSFGPAVITATWDHDHWIYWVGPGVGALFAVMFYKAIKLLEYEMANPGQDSDMAHEPEKEVSHEEPKSGPNRLLRALGVQARHISPKSVDEERSISSSYSKPRSLAKPSELVGSSVQARDDNGMPFVPPAKGVPPPTDGGLF